MVTNNIGKRVTEGVFRRYKRARRKLVRLDEGKILEALKSFGAFRSDLLFVHSSLSACGSIEGGPGTVVNALRSWISDRAALAMPTHTWSYPDKTGVAPVYDYTSTPSVVGTITNHYWRQPGVVRSLHPSHSVACSGPDAENLCAGHETLETPCGAGTPYLRMAEGNSSVLMFGATMDSYTLFHTAEDAAEVPYLYAPEQVTLRTKGKDGVVREIQMWRQDMGVARRFAATANWLEEQDLLIRRKLGLSELLFIPNARALHETMVKALRRNPLFLVDEKARAGVANRNRPA
ncbi:MAG TPA: AAC(3) family N-acetyltransferase [Pyrinomonadaceae bacterium]|nr:AAC(3) family N-acetyltransferase [Pyrinomonadaceae bacterium]